MAPLTVVGDVSTDDVLTPDALAFVADLDATFEARRQSLLNESGESFQFHETANKELKPRMDTDGHG